MPERGDLKASLYRWIYQGYLHIFHDFLNPLSPHDALKHHFSSLKTQFISLQLRVLEGKCP